MTDRKNLLTETDNNAVMLGDSNYLTGKGAQLYQPGSYRDAVEYYRLAAAMGNVTAISNLGYCYLYGRDIEPDLSLAIAYFKLAALREDVTAAYKLGDIYESGKWGVRDPEAAVYYYRMAASFVIKTDWEDAADYRELENYPSLCYALGRALCPGGLMRTDIRCAYQFLRHAEKGYRIELENGCDFYEQSYAGVVKLLADPIFNVIREENDLSFRADPTDAQISSLS